MQDNTNATDWQFYTTSKDAWRAMLEACRSAKHSIEFEQFYFMPGVIGREFMQVLIQKSKENVHIRCLFDAAGSFPFSRSIYPDLLSHTKIEVRFFNWLFPYSQGNKRLWYFRNHRRNLIIDDKIAFTGGVCIADRMRDWRDTQVSMRGPVVQQMSAAFEKVWSKANNQNLRFNKDSRMDADGFTYSTHSPHRKQRFLYYRLIEAIRHARHSVYLTTPYFLPDRRLLRVLRLARRRGVDVRVVMPKVSNHPVVDIGAHTYFDKVLSSGIRVYQYPTMTHAKTAVIDSDWAMVGSLNLDNISLRYNFESAIVSANRKFAVEVEKQFMIDIEGSHELTLNEWERRSLIRKIKEALVWPIRKFL